MEPRPSTIDALLAQLRERHGARSVSRGADVVARAAPRTLPSGLAALDAALPGGGLPRGALTELVGPPSAGAGSLALRAVARAQTEGSLACILDLGGTFAPAAAAGLGVDLDALAVARPASGAEAALVVGTLLARRAVGALLVDSLPRWLGLPGGPAALAALQRRLPRALAESGCALIVLNPLPTGLLPDPELAPLTTLAAVAALRLRLAHAGWLRRGPAIAGACARVEVLRPPFDAPLARVVIELAFVSLEDGPQMTQMEQRAQMEGEYKALIEPAHVLPATSHTKTSAASAPSAPSADWLLPLASHTKTSAASAPSASSAGRPAPGHQP